MKKHKYISVLNGSGEEYPFYQIDEDNKIVKINGIMPTNITIIAPHIEGFTFIGGEVSTFITGANCKFEVGRDCTIRCRHSCEIKCGYNCVIDSERKCKFNLGEGCVVRTYGSAEIYARYGESQIVCFGAVGSGNTGKHIRCQIKEGEKINISN